MLYFAIQELLAHHTHLSPCYKDYIHVDMKVMPMNNSGTKKEGSEPNLQQGGRLCSFYGVHWSGRLLVRPGFPPWQAAFTGRKNNGLSGSDTGKSEEPSLFEVFAPS